MNIIYKKFLDQLPGEDVSDMEELALEFIEKEYEEHVKKYSK